jgi:small subunit ribosomal protein S11
MGKKKIVKETPEEAIKEREALESALKRAEESKIPTTSLKRGRIYINVSYNNTLITVTDEKGNVITWASAGSLGFKGPKKATPFAAARVAEAILEKLKKTGLQEVEIYVKGVGGGREAAIRAFAARGLEITLIKDVTPIPHNGPKPPKPRRV